MDLWICWNFVPASRDDVDAHRFDTETGTVYVAFVADALPDAALVVEIVADVVTAVADADPGVVDVAVCCYSLVFRDQSVFFAGTMLMKMNPST